jgi:hypothetical protein
LVLRRGVPLPLFKLVFSLSVRWLMWWFGRWASIVWLFREMDIPCNPDVSIQSHLYISTYPRDNPFKSHLPHLLPTKQSIFHDLSCDAIHPQHSIQASIPPQMSPKYVPTRPTKRDKPTNAHALLELSQLGSIHLCCE